MSKNIKEFNIIRSTLAWGGFGHVHGDFCCFGKSHSQLHVQANRCMKQEGQTDCLLRVTFVKLHPIKIFTQPSRVLLLCKLFEWILFFFSCRWS